MLNPLIKRFSDGTSQLSTKLAGSFGSITKPNIFPFGLFFFAFAIRAIYLCTSEHRVVQFGDAFYYLTTGALLSKALLTAGDAQSFLQQMISATPVNPEDGNSFTSALLPIRILLDGPIFPSYLAVLSLLFGFVARPELQFESYCLKIALANSFIDSLSCVLLYFLGTRIAGRKVGAVAAFLLAIYPGAVINQARAYSEPFAYFLVLAFMSLVIFVRTAKLKMPLLAFCGILCGVLAASVALVKPMFVLLVASAVVALLLGDRLTSENTSQWYQKWQPKRRWVAVALTAAGAVLVFLPWVQITTSSLGKPTFLVSRAPAYNLFVGNQIHTDGWKTWPLFGMFSGNVERVTANIVQAFSEHPVEMVALELKKLPRLWAGVWNEFQYSFFGIPFHQQNVLHSLLLVFAFVGMLVLWWRARAEARFEQIFAGIFLVALFAIHFLYIGFEPISRYALTAMPFVCLLAALAIVHFARRRAFIAPAVIVFGFGALFNGLMLRSSIAPILLQTFSALDIFTARFIEEICVVIIWIVLAQVLIMGIDRVRLISFGRRSRAVVFAAFAFAALSWFCCSHFDQSKREWYCDLRTKMQTVSQEMVLPAESDIAGFLSDKQDDDALNPMNTVFLLCDMQSIMGEPKVTVTVNRIPWRTVALPWHQVNNKDADIATVMNMQGSAMSKDWRSFRQWWAIPIPRGLLIPGEPNEIALGFSFGESPISVRLFGDYIGANEMHSYPMPSFNLFSWTRGFATYDNWDTRVYELKEDLNEIIFPALWFTRVSESQDLSPEPGLQNGAYRIRLAIPRAQRKDVAKNSTETTEVAEAAKITLPPLTHEHEVKLAPVLLYTQVDDVTVDGGNPQTYMLLKEPVKLPEDLQPNAVVEFSCMLKSDRERQAGPVTLVFSGQDETGKEVRWTSEWQPTAVSVDESWRPFLSSCIIPEKVRKLKNVSVNVMINPFQTDLLMLNKRKALHEVVLLKDSGLTLYAPVRLPKADKYQWIIF